VIGSFYQPRIKVLQVSQQDFQKDIKNIICTTEASLIKHAQWISELGFMACLIFINVSGHFPFSLGLNVMEISKLLNKQFVIKADPPDFFSAYGKVNHTHFWVVACLLLNDAKLKSKHCQKPHCCNGVVDTFQQFLSL
jgi:hypothetical protein